MEFTSSVKLSEDEVEAFASSLARFERFRGRVPMAAAGVGTLVVAFTEPVAAVITGAMCSF